MVHMVMAVVVIMVQVQVLLMHYSQNRGAGLILFVTHSSASCLITSPVTVRYPIAEAVGHGLHFEIPNSSLSCHEGKGNWTLLQVNG